LSLLAWLCLLVRLPKVFLALLVVWLSFELATAHTPKTVPNRAPRLEMALARAKGVRLDSFQGGYTLGNHPIDSDISYNGEGWEPETGFAADIVTLAVDQPQFVELLVGDRRMINGEPARPDMYRAQMDGVFLPVRQVQREGRQWKVQFDVPPKLRQGTSLLFLGFSASYDQTDRDSERILHSVRWR
jgi:hypothetical protein